MNRNTGCGGHAAGTSGPGELGQRIVACTRCEARPFSLCRAIPDGDIARLAAASTSFDVAPGASFLEEGEPATDFFNITRGTVKLYKLLPDGRRQVTGFMEVGDFLGLAVSDTYVFTAEALDAVRVCRFSRRRLEALLDDFPALERRLLEIASHELVAAQEQMLLLGRKTALERLASFLLSRADRHGPAGRMALPMSRTDIADYLGLTIETVSRSFSRLRSEGILALPDPHGFRILDRAALEARSGIESAIL